MYGTPRKNGTMDEASNKKMSCANPIFAHFALNPCHPLGRHRGIRAPHSKRVVESSYRNC